MAEDPFRHFKEIQRESWSLFAPLEALTTHAAGYVVDFAGVRSGARVLDVACGTGVVAITAARRGAQAAGLDLAPALLERARYNASLAEVEVQFQEGDVEQLPYGDGQFDYVLSQFGHMFAPRPDIAIAEMLRVLKPGGVLCFATWPPELYTGKMFALVAKYLPPPAGISPPPLWGDPNFVREKLGNGVTNLSFNREVIIFPVLSPQHAIDNFERTAGPLIKLREKYEKEDPAALKSFRREFAELITQYTKLNSLQQHFLLTRANKCS